MEQSWTFDKYDMPSGDLEFWAIRRGMVPSRSTGIWRVRHRAGQFLRKLRGEA